MDAKRNLGIDQLRVILAFLVVVIHVFTSVGQVAPGLVNYYLGNGLPRVAVPLFFMISGYFSQRKFQNFSRTWATVKSLFFLFLVWQVIYIVLIASLPQENPVPLSPVMVFRGLVYGIGPLWYLFALAAALPLAFLLRKVAPAVQVLVAFVLYFVGYGLWFLDQSGALQATGLFYDVYQWLGTSRNFLFMGLPFVLLGANHATWSGMGTRVLFALGLVLLALEPYAYFTWHMVYMDFTLFSPLIALPLFDFVTKKELLGGLRFNKNLSLGIFLLHLPLLYLVKAILRGWGIELGYFELFGVVLLVTLLVWLPLEQLNRYVPLFFEPPSLWRSSANRKAYRLEGRPDTARHQLSQWWQGLRRR